MIDPPFDMPGLWFHSTEEDPVRIAEDLTQAVDPVGVVRAGTCEIWFSDCWYASRYYGPNTVRAVLALENPLLVTSDQFREVGIGPSTGWARRARDAGHDSVVIHDIMDGDAYSTVCAIFDPALAEAVAHSVWDEEAQDFKLL